MTAPPEPPEQLDDRYIVVSADGTDPMMTWFYENPGNVIIFGERVIRYEFGVDETTDHERLRVLATTSGTIDGVTVLAEIPVIDYEGGETAHNYGMYVYGDVVALLGFSSVWEVDEAGTQTIVPIIDAMTAYMPPFRHVSNQGQPSLRVANSVPGIFEPETAAIPVVNPDTDRLDVPQWHGIVRMDYGGLGSYEDLPGDDPFVVSVRIDAQMFTPDVGEPSLYFSGYFDQDEFGTYASYPFEFWTSATFHYTMSGLPPGASAAETRLWAKYAGSAGPIAGDSMTDSLAGSESLAMTGFSVAPGDPYYGLYPNWYVTMISGPGDYANLSAYVTAMWIEGEYTVTPQTPWRQTYDRTEMEWLPSILDLMTQTAESTAWGAPVLGSGALEPVNSSWWRGPTKYLVAVAAQWQLTHYPYTGTGPDNDGIPYEIRKFTIATRADDPVETEIASELDLTRCRFVRSRP